MDEVEEILWLQGNARGLFQLGSTLDQHGDIERSSRAMGLATELDRAAGTPLNLTNAAQALYNVAVSMERLERPSQEIEAVYREVVTLGLNAGIPEAQDVLANSLFNLGCCLYRRDGEPQEIEAVWRSAALAGRGAGAWGGPVGSKALFNLAMALADWEREPQEIEAAYREAAVAGRESATPEGLAGC